MCSKLCIYYEGTEKSKATDKETIKGMYYEDE